MTPPRSSSWGFHELARRATCFHYQNDWQIQLSHLRLITAEEVLYHDRASAQTLETVNRYFKGLIHPERSVFGHGMDRLDAKAEGDLRQQLSESRRWLIRYGSRNSTLLSEWARGWRLLRDLECACVTLKAGLQVPKKQFTADTIEELQQEVIKQRANLDNLEDGLRLMGVPDGKPHGQLLGVALAGRPPRPCRPLSARPAGPCLIGS